MAAAPIFPGSINAGQQTFVNADGTTKKTLLTAGSSGTRVDTISATSDDTSTRVMQLWVTTGGVDYLLGEVSITLGAGSDGTTKAISVLNVTDLPWVRDEGGNKVIYLESGEVLKGMMKVAVTAAKTIYLRAQGADY